jgi:hypothetical protein
LLFTYPEASINDIKLEEKPSALEREDPALQMNFRNCFLFFWVIFALLDPDLDPDLVSPIEPRSEYRSGSDPQFTTYHAVFDKSVCLILKNST